MKLKKLLKISIMAVVGLLVLAATAIGMAYLRQDRLVAEAVKQFNSTFNGRFAIEGSHISPFENFPYVSIDLDHVQVYQHKDTAQAAAIDVAHVYVGFNLWSIITGGFEVKKIKLSNGTNNILSELLIERLTSSFAMTESHIKASLNNFAAFSAMTDYFTDKNLNNVRFDTLKNTLQLKNGALTIPNMNLNTSLGYFEIAGTQGVDLTMDYTMRIPLKVIARAGMQRLFGKKDRDTSNQVDDIQYRDQSKRTRFVTVNIAGTPDDYKVSLGKGKKRKD